jgi:hypothetical protein
MTLGIVRTSWIGTSGGAGLTQLVINHSETDQVAITASEAQGAVNAVRAYWDAIKALMPDELIFTVSPVVDQYDWGTGALIATVSAATAPATVGGTASGTYSMAAGAKMVLQTTKILDGRRVRGGIFLVPMAAAAMSATGNVSSATRSTVDTAGNTMRTALTTAGVPLMVWSRPTSPGPSTDGELSTVTSVETSEKSAILRGRRD